MSLVLRPTSRPSRMLNPCTLVLASKPRVAANSAPGVGAESKRHSVLGSWRTAGFPPVTASGLNMSTRRITPSDPSGCRLQPDTAAAASRPATTLDHHFGDTTDA